MKRRRVIVGLGGMSVGLSSVFSTGAFSNTQADRTISLAVVNDENAYLRFSDTHAAGTGQMFATWRDGMVEFRFDENDGIIGQGLGADSRYRFDNVFVAENQGTQTVCLYGKYEDDAVTNIELLQSSTVNDISTGNGGRIAPLTESNPSDKLEPGDKILLGFAIDTTNIDPGSIETSFTIVAYTPTE